MEWSVESMHCLLDIHYGEDYCCIQNRTIQQYLNMLRKLALGLIKQYKTRIDSKCAISKIMFDYLLDAGVFFQFWIIDFRADIRIAIDIYAESVRNNESSG